MIQLLKNILRKILPITVRKRIGEIRFNIKLKQVQANHKKALECIRKKKKIKVAFFLIHDSIWKYEGVYKLMEQDKRFEPIVVVCPYITYGKEAMLREMHQAYENFKNKGYSVIKTLDENTGVWLDVKKEIKPDIIFFTNPHRLTRDEYYITNYLDLLTCYVPYAFVVIHLYQSHFNQLFHNYLWKAYYETSMHLEFAKIHANNLGKNVLITGYPSIDKLVDKNYTPKNPWKVKNQTVKNIIWAPHHTIDDNKSELSYSNFMRYHQLMFDLADKYKNSIQIAFKPHPLLKEKLYLEKDWGKDRTDAYYEYWDNLINGQLELSDYDDLFLTSDAMIHDSASFMVEYLYTKKPVAFTLRDENIADRFNSFGKIVFDYMYHISDENEMVNFIDVVVLQDKDEKKHERLRYVKNTLMPPNGKTASMNIFEDIVKEIS